MTNTTSSPNAAEAVRALASHRGISEDELWQAVADGLRTAYEALPNAHEGAVVSIDTENFEISVHVGTQDVTPEGFGRIAASVFRSSLDRAVSDSVRRTALARFRGYEGQLVEGTVRHVTDRRAVLEVEGVSGVLPRSAQIPGERLTRGDRVKAVIMELRDSGDDAILFSRTAPEFLTALIADLHSEVAAGRIELVAVAREPGRRSKVAVYSDGYKEPVAAFIGTGGSRIRPLQDELGPERLDVVAYSEDLQLFAASTLELPLAAISVVETEDGTLVEAHCDRSLIGRVMGQAGSNIRLAEQLLGYPVKIVAAN
jgi:transcription termination/antitermination protein NusA